jgi:predicted regulator of Ras-like GTPase activity (Roadblock/LC7/MglB family)
VPGIKSGEDAEVTEDALLALLRALRDRAVGITDTALASLDGLIITSDTVGIDPDNLAALAAASLGIAQRMSAQAGQGTLREATTRSSGGIVAVYAVGTSALLVVVGDEGLDVVRLHRESRPTVEAIEVLLKRGQSGIGGAGMAAS